MGGRGASSGMAGNNVKANQYESILSKEKKYFTQDNFYALQKSEGGLENVDIDSLNKAYGNILNKEAKGYTYDKHNLSDEALKDKFGDAGAYYIKANGGLATKFKEEKGDFVVYEITSGRFEGQTIRERKSLAKYSKANSKTNRERIQNINAVGQEKMYKYAKSNNIKVTRKMDNSKLRKAIQDSGKKQDAINKKMYYSFSDEQKYRSFYK